MGREIVAHCQWQGQDGEAKLLLESDALILRGSVRARIARTAITAARAGNGGLTVIAGDDTLVAAMGEAEAERWAAAILKPLPSLATKLGIDAARPAFVVGPTDDPALAAALSGATTAVIAEAAVVVAVVGDAAGLAAAVARAGPRPLWCVYGKGKASAFGDSDVRGFMRERGWIDSKSCAVSERLTATRYAAADNSTA